MAGSRCAWARLLMKNNLWHPGRAGFLGLLFLILLFLCLVRLPFLVISDRDEESVLYLSLTGRKDFSLYYLHSVHRTPVWENFSTGPGGRLVLTSTVFETLGAGIPFLPGEGSLSTDGGRYVLSGLNRIFPEISLGLAPVSGQALVCRGKHYRLDGYFSPGSVIRIRLENLSPGEVLWQRFVFGGELLD